MVANQRESLLRTLAVLTSKLTEIRWLDYISNGYGRRDFEAKNRNGRWLLLPLSMNFIKPISGACCLLLRWQTAKIGRSSTKIKVEVWVKKKWRVEPIGERYCVTDAVFTFFAVDNNGRSLTIPGK